MAKFAKTKSNEIPAIPYESCRAKTCADGKPGLTVWDHSIIVAEVTAALLEMLPDNIRQAIPPGTTSVAALHDTGKICPGFQLKYFQQHLQQAASALASRDISGFCTDHAHISGGAINNHAQGHKPRIKSLTAASIAAAHHGKGQAPLDDWDAIYGGPEWARERARFIDRIIGEYGPLPEEEAISKMRKVVAGLVSVADWIGSDENYFPPERIGVPREEARDKARKAVRACGWSFPQWQPGLSFSDIFGNDAYPMQSRFVDMVAGPGLYILEAPMGMGKTEAALYAAYKLLLSGKASGIYFGLPTRLTSDRIHERMRTFMQKICAHAADVKLAHGTAWLKGFFEHGSPNREEDKSSAWFNPRKRTLLHPFGVGTIDQALLSVLRVKHSFVRTFGLAGKVVILDEVHSYDIYTGTLLDLLVEELLQTGCTVIVLSATLTRERRNQLLTKANAGGQAHNLEYPLITAASVAGIREIPCPAPAPRTIDIRMLPLDNAGVAELAVNKAIAGQNILCIANTVALAQEWYAQVKASMPENAFPVGLLHSKFTQCRRQELEDTWMQNLGKDGDRPGGSILVATQVVEQSVDIDADFMITQLAPTDMLLQRMGRLWRHERPDRACDSAGAVIVCRDLGAARTRDEFDELLGKRDGRVYSPYVLWKSWQVWNQRNMITLPGDIRDLLETTYQRDSNAEPAFVRELHNLQQEKRKKLSAEAQAATAEEGLPTMPDREDVCTRYSEISTCDCLLLKEYDDLGKQVAFHLLDNQDFKLEAGRKDFRVLANLYRHMVTLPVWQLSKFNAKPCKILARDYFQQVKILLVSEDGSLLTDGRQQTDLAYTPEKGIYRISVKAGEPVSHTQTGYGFSDYDIDEDFNGYNEEEYDELVW